ncbi:hypothetical protein ACXR2T_09840 [Leucobacter sp. HY1910]
MTDARAQLENKLAGLHGVLRRFEDLQAQEQAIYQQHQHRYVRYLNRWRGGMYWLWVLILTAVFSVFAFSIMVSAIGRASLEAGPSGSYESASSMMAPMLWLLLPLPLALIGAAVVLAIRNGGLAKTNAKREQQNETIAQQIGNETWPAVQQVQAQLEQTRQEYRQGYSGFFPSDYLNTDDVRECWQIVHEYRASTVQDAMNVYKNVLHQRYLENMAAAQLATQERIERTAKISGIVQAGLTGAVLGQQSAEFAANRAYRARPQTVNVRIK